MSSFFSLVSLFLIFPCPFPWLSYLYTCATARLRQFPLGKQHGALELSPASLKQCGPCS
ncbi:hypothetical protein MYCTH_2303669 [Thermothelomyces thermophilus ATCC 42464]|uniref:Uncharacterized protein n=1 Tax=Thermothelomyces thermophilus (strain ATCC 42464 / BCRC 31852 / DSM 1799) TaxID=573729 RepID=G2QD99_THET4|nr:uncharacterized protein MYCTH_2303669 [Thermothelomyces thermophilus ATCC 42464]AEO57465.1 hypothetical protein MYCTH_2303669 [Thermothelomyces thermophilus ATCC 42464]